MDWYDTVIGPQGDQKFDDTVSQDEPMVDMEMDSEDAAHPPQDNSFLSSRAPTPRPAQLDTEPSLPQHPSLDAFGFNPQFTYKRNDPVPETGKPASEAFVSDAADNLINVMTKMMNGRGRRPSQQSDEGVDVESGNSQLSPPQRQMLQKVFSVALERLSDEVPSAPESSDDKQDWFECDICSKRTRLRCEMK